LATRPAACGRESARNAHRASVRARRTSWPAAAGTGTSLRLTGRACERAAADSDGCRYAIPHMLRAGHGSLINTSSVNGLVAEPLRAIYATSTGAIIMDGAMTAK
jgi:short chain dehydrogenase